MQFSSSVPFLFPYLSLSSFNSRADLRFGGNCGELLYKPPDGFEPVFFHDEVGKVSPLHCCDYIFKRSFVFFKDIQIRPFFDIGNKEEGHLKGPQIIAGQIPFIPSVIDTSQVHR